MRYRYNEEEDLNKNEFEVPTLSVDQNTQDLLLQEKMRNDRVNPDVAQFVQSRRAPASEMPPLPPPTPELPPEDSALKQRLLLALNEKVDPSKYGILSPEQLASQKSERNKLVQSQASQQDASDLFAIGSIAGDALATTGAGIRSKALPNSSALREQVGKFSKSHESKLKGFDEQAEMGDKQSDRHLKVDTLESGRKDRALNLLRMIEESKQKSLDRKAALEASQNEKQKAANKSISQRRTDFVKELANPSNRKAIGGPVKIIQASDRFDAFIGNKDPNNLMPGELYEAAVLMDSIARSGGMPTVSGTQHLMPRALLSDKAKATQYLSSKPQAAQMGQFIKRFKATVDRERAMAMKQKEEIMKPYKYAFSDLYEADPEGFEKAFNEIGQIGERSNAPAQTSGGEPDFESMSVEDLKKYLGK